jgi:capsular polysaccharide transport system permease protein
MTTPPKVNRFRIRRGPPPAADPAFAEAAAAAPAAGPAAGQPPAVDEDGFGPGPFPTAEQDMLRAPPGRPASGAAEPRPDTVEAVVAEGLTARQLRLARRIADRHGVVAASDHEAVLLLRRRGVDPFQRSSLLALVAGERLAPAPDAAAPTAATGRAPGGPGADAAAAPNRLPQTTRPGPASAPMRAPAPGTAAVDPDRRRAEIARIQADLARRRRRKTVMLFARLATFVLAPTLVVAWYLYMVATPLYATKSEFVIQQAEPAAAAGMGSLLRGTQFATSQDSITVQSYMQSREAMQRLDADLGFKAHFSQEGVDPLQRLDPGATNEAAYKLYTRNVKISFDPTEGLIKMEVIALDPQVSAEFSRALIGYAEEQVDQLTQRLREDQMKGARDSYKDAEARVSEAQRHVLELQEQLGVLDPLVESNVVMSQVSQLESQLQQKRLELGQLLDNEAPNQARVEGAQGDIARLEQAIVNLRAQLTKGTAQSASLASVTGQLRIAEADLETRQLMLSQSLQSLENARIEANRQVRYLSMGVSPVAPDEPTYPRKFENTVLALLVFSGIYLMMSLTASILREQVTA